MRAKHDGNFSRLILTSPGNDEEDAAKQEKLLGGKTNKLQVNMTRSVQQVDES